MTTEPQRAAFSQFHELNFAYETEKSGRFRVNIMLQKGRGAIVLRRIPRLIQTIDELGLPPVVKTIALEKRGLVLVAGSSGSGKSTTLASMVDYRNRHSAGHIITIEDPIEFVHDHHKSIVHQREIGMDTESWQVALKNTLRQSPDVIMIGEIRDHETMQQAIAFAETGHLCMATIHSNNANQALDRVMNFFPIERRRRGAAAKPLCVRTDCSGRDRRPRGSDGKRPAVRHANL